MGWEKLSNFAVYYIIKVSVMRKFVFVAGVALAFVTSCNMENPLLTESKLPYGAPQFDKIRNEHYMPAFEQGIAEAKAEIDASHGICRTDT